MITIHWKALLAAFFIFVAGIAVGVFATVGLGLRHNRALLRAPATTQSRFERATDRFEKRLAEELDLDAAQAAIVHREFARTADEMRELRVDTVQRTRRTVAATIRRIGAQLPPEKREELRKLALQRLTRLGLELPVDTDPQSVPPAPPPPSATPAPAK